MLRNRIRTAKSEAYINIIIEVQDSSTGPTYREVAVVRNIRKDSHDGSKAIMVARLGRHLLLFGGSASFVGCLLPS